MLPQLKYYLCLPCHIRLKIHLNSRLLKKITLEKGQRSQLECLFYPEDKIVDKDLIDLIQKTLLWFTLYFSKKTPDFTLPLLTPPTDFSSLVLEKLCSVPFGKTVTYKELGTLASSPGAARAVGSALNKNLYPIIVPCHRVVSKSDIGGFAYPLEIKQLLLAFEQGIPQLTLF